MTVTRGAFVQWPHIFRIESGKEHFSWGYARVLRWACMRRRTRLIFLSPLCQIGREQTEDDFGWGESRERQTVVRHDWSSQELCWNITHHSSTLTLQLHCGTRLLYWHPQRVSSRFRLLMYLRHLQYSSLNLWTTLSCNGLINAEVSRTLFIWVDLHTLLGRKEPTWGLFAIHLHFILWGKGEL